MKVTINKLEPLISDDSKMFAYFDYLGRQVRTIITPKSLKYLKVEKISVGEIVDVQKGVRNNKVVYIITKVMRNG